MPNYTVSKTKQKVNRFKIFWLYFFPIASYYFYFYVGISSTVEKGTFFVALPITIFLSFNGLNKFHSKKYAKFLLLILSIMSLSMLNSFVFHKQSFILSYKVTAQYMSIAYFFYLLSIKPNQKQIENLIWFLCIFYILLWIYGLSKVPEVIFGNNFDEIVDDSRGILRLRMVGSGITVLAFFMSINKFIDSQKKIWILVFSLLYIVIFLHVTRQVIVLTFIIGVTYLFYKIKWKWFIMFGAFFFYLIIGTIKFSNDAIVTKIINISEEQISNQKKAGEDIRITGYKHFFFNYSESVYTFLLGNGVSHGESDFGKKDIRLAKKRLLWDSDVGYAHIFIRFGAISLILYIIIIYRAVKQRTDRRLLYAKLYIIYLIFANIASTPILWEPVLLSITLYLLEFDSHRQRFIERKIICQ